MHQVKKLHKKFDALQSKHGDPILSSVYGAGCIKNPQVCLVFMNPTMRNTSSLKDWKGLRAPWIGTKNIWNLLSKINLFDNKLNKEIQKKTAKEWSPDFSKKVYTEVAKRKLYITNLSKATQLDARALKDSVFREYLQSLGEELSAINPKIIITFGNQVSSILLNENIKVSECRKQEYKLNVKNKIYSVYPVFYPVGQGMRNIKKAIGDLKHIIKNK